MTNAASTRRQGDDGAEQLTLLPSSNVHARFRLNRATRERGLRHVAEIRRQLAEREAAQVAAESERRLRPRHQQAA